MTQLLVTADDRTGALEVGGIIGSPGRPIAVGPKASDEICCVVDIDSRQQSGTDAASRTLVAHQLPAKYRAHKIDSGLRGNWHREVFALANAGHRIAIVPAYPDAGRVCIDGTVYVHGLPVLESAFAADPLTRPISSKPADVLDSNECTHKNIAIWDAADNEALQSAARRCVEEQRVMVGPTGAIGAYATEILGTTPPPVPIPTGSMLILSGSLNETSRQQIRVLDLPVAEPLMMSALTYPIGIIQSPFVTGAVTPHEATAMGNKLIKAATPVFQDYTTLMIIGGDTCTLCFGNDTLRVFGMIAPGIPLARWRDKTVITKGGGIGTQTSLQEIVAGTLVGSKG